MPPTTKKPALPQRLREESDPQSRKKSAGNKSTPEHPPAIHHVNPLSNIGDPQIPVSNPMDVNNGEYPELAPPKGGGGASYAEKAKQKGKEKKKAGAPDAQRPSTTKLRKQKKKQEADQGQVDVFWAALAEEAPELTEQVKAQHEEDNRDTYTVEMVCTPDAAWKVRGPNPGPDLAEFENQRDMLAILNITSGVGASETLNLVPTKQLKIEGLARKASYFQLTCTSSVALAMETIMAAAACRMYKGYKLEYFQPKDSRFGYKFQVLMRNLPSPFKDYNVKHWLQVLVAQGWDPASITHIQFATRAVPGQMAVLTGMLDIYVKPEALLSHGCDAALGGAGTEHEHLAKEIDYPPTCVMLGKNSSPEAADMLALGLLKGQYYETRPNTRPSGSLNQMQEAEAGTYIPQTEWGKTWVRPVVKLGACKHCWGPKHESRGDECLYKLHCKQCLAKVTELPYQGFHHACGSMVESTPKPDKEFWVGVKRKKAADAYDPGEPADPNYAAYHKSEGMSNSQKIRQEMKVKQQQRKQKEKEAQAAQEAEQARYNQENEQLTQDEIEEQNYAMEQDN